MEPSWEWTVADDPGFGRRVDKRVTLRGGVLTYTGFVDDPGWGGDYAIGSQTTAEFLADGPLGEGMPDALAERIRAHLRDRA